jgi:hypothetical protein
MKVITFRIRISQIIFANISPTSSLIKKIYKMDEERITPQQMGIPPKVLLKLKVIDWKFCDSCHELERFFWRKT